MITEGTASIAQYRIAHKELMASEVKSAHLSKRWRYLPAPERARTDTWLFRNFVMNAAKSPGWQPGNVWSEWCETHVTGWKETN